MEINKASDKAGIIIVSIMFLLLIFSQVNSSEYLGNILYYALLFFAVLLFIIISKRTKRK